MRPDQCRFVLLKDRFTDFDVLSQYVRGFGLDWLQLDSGPLDVAVQQIGYPSVLLSRFRFNRKFHQRGAPPPGMLTFAILSPQSPPVRWGRHDSGRGRMVVFPTEEDYQFVSRPGFAGDTISISKEVLQGAADLLEYDLKTTMPHGQGFIDVDPDAAARVRRLLTSIHSIPDSEPGSRGTLDREFEVASALLQMIGRRRTHVEFRVTPRKRRSALERALAFIDQHAQQSPLIEDMCHAAGTSWRTLDYAFREEFDMTPKQYLDARRLIGVRRDLVRTSPETPVSEVSKRWGFTHQSWFSDAYKNKFGELPSATRRDRTADG